MGAQAKLADFRPDSHGVEYPTTAPRAMQHDLLRFITCGSVDDGKSTLIGRLLYESEALTEDQLAALCADSKTFGAQGSRLDFALLVDGLAAEREQGITIDVAYRYFSTARRSFIVADTPGHEQYTRNMATGASTASLAIVLVDARKGVLAQTRRHSLILSMFGVSQVVLAVNKMDLVGYGERTFADIDREYRAFAAPLGFADVVSIPISALHGDNLRRRSAHMPWYRGPTLLDHLEAVAADDGGSQRAFRMPVQWVNRASPDLRGFSGLIASGTVHRGDAVRIMPSGRMAHVGRIVTYNGDLERAEAGQSITLVLDRELDVSRGDVIVSAVAPAAATQSFAATLLWTAGEPFEPGRPLLLKAAARTVPVRLDGDLEVLDISSGVRRHSHALQVNDIAACTLATDAPIVVEPYVTNRELGGFILIDRLSGDTVALGMVDSIEPRVRELGATRAWRSWVGSSCERPWRSITKAVTWRATGSVDTFILAWLFTGSVKISAAISATEMFTKVALYYGHERVWARISAGIRPRHRAETNANEPGWQAANPQRS